MKECESTANLMSNSTGIECFTTNETFADANFYCKKLLYDFTFYEMIAKWAVVGLALVVLMLVCCCCCCAYCCVSKKMKDQSTELAGTHNKTYS